MSVLFAGGSCEHFAAISSWFTFEEFLGNVPTTALCFGLPDLFSQLLGGERGRVIDFAQVASAAAIGVFMNAFGFVLWLHYLEILFPSDVVGSGSHYGVLLLVCKSLTDSLVWGTASNTAVLLGKRIMAGDSIGRALEVWNYTIMDVTKTELGFWPVWQAINFCFMPKVPVKQCLPLCGTKMGSLMECMHLLIWNVLSPMISSSPHPLVCLSACTRLASTWCPVLSSSDHTPVHTLCATAHKFQEAWV